MNMVDERLLSYIERNYIGFNCMLLFFAFCFWGTAGVLISVFPLVILFGQRIYDPVWHLHFRVFTYFLFFPWLILLFTYYCFGPSIVFFFMCIVMCIIVYFVGHLMLFFGVFSDLFFSLLEEMFYRAILPRS